MATTYDPTLPTPKDVVRFELSDKAEPWKYTDEEINYQLSVTPNAFLSAAELAERLSSQFSTRASKTVGPLTIRYSEQASGWASTAATLRRKAARGARVVSTGGTGHLFRIGMSDNTGTIDVDQAGLNTSIGDQT